MIYITDDDVINAMDVAEEPVQLMLRLLECFASEAFTRKAIDRIVGPHPFQAEQIRQINNSKIMRAQLAALYAMIGPIYMASERALPYVKESHLQQAVDRFNNEDEKTAQEMFNSFVQQFGLHDSWLAYIDAQLDHIPRLEDRITVMHLASAFLIALGTAIDSDNSDWINRVLQLASRRPKK